METGQHPNFRETRASGPSILVISPTTLFTPAWLPGVLEELRRVVPKRETGRGRKYPFTRRLTEEIGHPKLREHLASVTTIMRLSEQYDDFEVKLDRIHPRYDETLQLPFFDEEAAN